MSAAIATFGKVPQTCRTCTRPEGKRMRAAWGCDGPTTTPLFAVDCPRCFGRSHDCERCGGSGQEHVYRCPHATATPAIMRACEYSTLLEVGILPVAGGWEDQSVTFVEAVRLVGMTRADIDRTAAEKAEAIGRG